MPPEHSLQDVLADLFDEGPPEAHSPLPHLLPRTAPQDSLLSRSADLCCHPVRYQSADLLDVRRPECADLSSNRLVHTLAVC